MAIQEAKQLFEEGKQSALEWLHQETAGLRSNRVQPGAVLNIPVEMYGTRSPMQTIASVSSSDARTLIISPYDKASIQAIEKAVTQANLGALPTVDGQIIRLVFPSLNEETRAQTIKVLHNKAEEARVRMRQSRDEAIRSLKQAKEAGDISEDDFFSGKKKLDELIGAANKEVEAIVVKKEEDIKVI